MSKRKANKLEILRKSLMMEQGIRQEDLAARWKTTQSFVSSLLSGKCRSLDREKDFAKLMGLPWEKLFPPHRNDENDDRPRRVASG